MIVSMPCKFNIENPFIFEAVERIKMFMPHAKIVVHDSYSQDQSYLDKLSEVTIINDNRGYETSAIWNTFRYFPNEDYYFFLHDSIHLKDDISKFADKDLCTLAYFPGYFWFMEDEQELAHFELEKTDYEFDMNFQGVFGSVFGCKPSVLKALYDKRFYSVVPYNKLGSRTMERLWGMALTQEGYGDLIAENSIFGLCTDIHALENKYFKKYIVRRQ